MTLGRCLVIANPAARHGVSGSLIPVVRELLHNIAACELAISSEPLHGVELARDAERVDTLVALGGDGTVHEVLNGLMQRPAKDRPALSVIPTGSGNDYCRTLGISLDLATAVRQIVRGQRRRMDVGVANGVYFANSVAVGLDARVTAKAIEMSVTTGWSGLPLYLRSLFYVLFNQYYSHRVRLQFNDEEPLDYDMLLVALTNGPTYGGGFRITPHADGADGLLDVCLVDRISLPNTLWRLPFVIVGKHTSMRPVHMSRRRRLRLWSEQPIEGQIDGEIMLESQYDIQVEPGALEVVAPER